MQETQFNLSFFFGSTILELLLFHCPNTILLYSNCLSVSEQNLPVLLKEQILNVALLSLEAEGKRSSFFALLIGLHVYIRCSVQLWSTVNKEGSLLLIFTKL